MTGECRRRTILIVEDDTDVREAIAEILEDGKYLTLRAANGQIALQTLRGAKCMPCLILLDVMMPVMDGREFRARQQEDAALNQIPVVVLSAHVDAQRAAAQLSAAGFLKKPLDLPDLLRTVEQFCGKN
jgi:CheY-like chemotaxis protein